MLNVQHANVYTDFNGLAELKNEAKSKTPEAIKEVAKQFESIFLNSVLKSMRAAKLADGIFDSDQSEFYQDMYDQQLAIHIAGDGGIGLSGLIIKQLSPEEESQEEGLGIDDYLNRSVNSPIPQTTLPEQVNIVTVPDLGEVQLVAKTKSDSLVNVLTELEVETEFDVEKKPEVVPQKLVNVNDKPLRTADEFVSQLLPYAEKAAAELGVDARVLLAQSALETGWGKSVIKNGKGESSHNLFNIKADRAWKGKQTKVSTLEYDGGVVRKEIAGFRTYPSYADSFNDYVNFIKSNPRYGNALKAVSKPEQYMKELQNAGYATDPGYAKKVMKIYHSEAFATVESPSLLAMKQ